MAVSIVLNIDATRVTEIRVQNTDIYQSFGLVDLFSFWALAIK